MSPNEIKYSIDNQEKIYAELEKIIESLPEELSKRCVELIGDGNIEEMYNIINSISPNSNITLSSLKLLNFLQNAGLKDKLFSNEEYTGIIKGIVDMYGDGLSEIMDTNSINFNINDLDCLLSLDDPKYSEVYKSILINKLALASVSSTQDVIEVLKNSNTSVVSEELIINFLENYNYYIIGSDVREILKTLPSSILQDGIIAKTMVGKINYILGGDEKILDYIPSSAYNPEFVKEILDKSKYNFKKVFEHIPTELRTRKIWERACNTDADYLNQLPDNNIDPSISQEEYTSWVENLITRTITKNPENAIYAFSNLDDSKKTTRICQKIAESNSIPEDSYSYHSFISNVPINSRTTKLYETLVLKVPGVLEDIPLESFSPYISNEQYNKWYENLISNVIANVQDMDALYKSIPRKKINERIWNEFLDKCIAENVDRSRASLSRVNFEHLTPQMVERAMKDISVTELFNVPCIDQNLEDLSGVRKEIYAKWQASFTEEQKQAYRTWYEKTWIKFVTENQAPEALYSNVPKEAITTDMNKACIDVNFTSIEKMPIPENPEQLHKYQQMLIYALGKIPAIDYKDYDTTFRYGNIDIFKNISKEFISEEVVRQAIEKNIIYLIYADPTAENFKELIDIAFKNKLASMGRTELTEQEKELMTRFALNNSDLFKTLDLKILNPEIVSILGESSLERIVRYSDVVDPIIELSENKDELKVFSFALENLKMDNTFVEPLIEDLRDKIHCYNDERKKNSNSKFLRLISQRIDKKELAFTDYEKAIITYLTLNPQENTKISSYDDVLNFVKNKNIELENIVNNNDSTLLDVKNAYLERIIGLKYNDVVNLVKMYGNDSEQLLLNYKNIDSDSFEKLSEKESLEIIIKLKSFIETQDINTIKSDFQKLIDQEQNEESYIKYQKSFVLENSLRRAYGREIVNSLSKNIDLLKEQEFEFEGEKYFVRKVNGEFNRMVSLQNAYRKSSVNDGDMYDRWNTSEMANNHALCYSFINQSNPGTAMINGKNGIIISINRFSPESLSAEAPYDLCSDNRKNKIYTGRQQRYFSSNNMPNQTRGIYSEYDIEIEDILSNNDKYQKIQPASIICFEKVDDDSIRAAIELGKKIGHPVPIEIIDRRELAQKEMSQILDDFTKFKSAKEMNSNLVEDIITRFNNVRNAHRFSDLSDELLGESDDKINNDAPFNKTHLNQLLMECLGSIEQKIRNGSVSEGLESLENIKIIISNERKKSYLMPTMDLKQEWSGIDMDIDYTIDELQRTYGQIKVNPINEIKTLNALPILKRENLSTITFDNLAHYNEIPSQFPAEEIIKFIDPEKIEDAVIDVNSKGFYQKNKSFDLEHISRVVMYSDVIAKMEDFNESEKNLLIESAKYYSCGRQLYVNEKYEQYSAKLAGKNLQDKINDEDIRIIQSVIELQSYEHSSYAKDISETKKSKKLSELCTKYNISNERIELVSKLSDCLHDSVILDKSRFIYKANNLVDQELDVNNLKLESSKKMIGFSCSLQEYLAQQELDKLSSIVKINFDNNTNKEIMDIFFTRHTEKAGIKVKPDKIVQSPIVKLEYIKEKYPEIFIEEYKTGKKLEDKQQLEEQRRNLRRKQFDKKIQEIGLNKEKALDLNDLFVQQKMMERVENSTLSTMHN